MKNWETQSTEYEYWGALEYAPGLYCPINWNRILTRNLEKIYSTKFLTADVNDIAYLNP